MRTSPRAASDSKRHNIDTIYQLDSDPALSAAEANLNALVPRDPYDINSRIGNGLSGLPSTDGNLQIPMLSLHDIGDLFVPFVLQQDYARKAAANGKSHLLVNRGIREYQHCAFTSAELAEAFDALTSWAETGVKPAWDRQRTAAFLRHLDPQARASSRYRGDARYPSMACDSGAS
jgi:hypothetical protein